MKKHSSTSPVLADLPHALAPAAGAPGFLGLYDLFQAQVAVRGDQPAVICGEATLSYADLEARAERLARRLERLGVGPEVVVGLCLERSTELVVGMLGILGAGGAYLPLDPSLPKDRLAFMAGDAGAQIVLASKHSVALFGEPILAVCVEDGDNFSATVLTSEVPAVGNAAAIRTSSPTPPDRLAYVIFTSGSTGNPKGVAIEHGAVVNTILDINARFGVGSDDRVLALSAAGFDLSVYDVFGLLAAGGAVVLPTEVTAREPQYWERIIAAQRVTIWNSVPALMEMLLTWVEATERDSLGSIRLVMLSGDWIPLTVPQRVRAVHPSVRLVGLGGATEASIWSIWFPIERIDPAWKSIPYGRPLSGQQVYVLDESLQPCGAGVVGQLVIGGLGVAREYIGQPELTAERFLPDGVPKRPGGRLYRTGDLGRYLPDGNIEFLGRVDHQIKINGYRIELGEIEAALAQHPAVRQAAAAAHSDHQQRKHLVAYVVWHADRPGQTAALRDFLRRKLPEYMVPAYFQTLDSLPLTGNKKIDRRALLPPAWQSNALGTSIAEPRDEVESRLLDIWRDVFRMPSLGVEHDFFEMGGDSLLATALFARIERAFNQAFFLATLVEAPTVSALAELVRAGQSDTGDWKPIVPLRLTGDGPPLFCLPGHGGNLLNFYALAKLLRAPRPIYGLLPPGLDGQNEVPDTIERIAARLVEGMQTMQPSGPYFMMGYSLGGLVAFEMTRQLEARGERVGSLILLDTASQGRPLWWRLLRDTRDWLELRRRRLLGLLVGARGRSGSTTRFPEHRFVAENRSKVERANRLHRKALDHYRPRPCRGRLLALRAEVRPTGIRKWFDDEPSSWLYLSGAGSQMRIVPGEHEEIFRPERIEVLAAQIDKYLTQCGVAATTDALWHTPFDPAVAAQAPAPGSS